MNRRKVLGVVAALAMALIGTIAIVAWVNNADERAASDEELVAVFVVDDRIPAGTEGESIEGFVILEEIPQKLTTSSTIGDLEDVAGLVTEVELLPGETLSIERFTTPAVFERELEREVAVPPGLQELTVALPPERAAGGVLAAGDTVGVLMSFQPFEVDSEVPVEVDGVVLPPDGSTPNTTTMVFHKLLVTNIQFEDLAQVEEKEGLGDEDDEDVRLAIKNDVLVTLAVDTATAERIVFGMENGSVWLTNEPADAVETPSIIQTRNTIYADPEEIEADTVGLSDDSEAVVIEVEE